VPPRARY